MYTVDEIRNVTFTKTLGGYKTGEVDDFIDICADTVEALTAEKEDLKKKMEMLANKVVEYRNDEDSIRSALLSAQRLGDTVLREANHKANLILDDARIKAEKMGQTAKQQIAEQLQELERMKKLVGEFKSKILGVYREHLSMIDVLPEYKEPEEEQSPTEEQSVEKTLPVAPEMPTEEIVQSEPEVVPVQEETIPETEDVAEISVEADEVTVEETPSVYEPEEDTARFSGLKFGVDYDMAADDDDEEDETAVADKKRHKRKFF